MRSRESDAVWRLVAFIFTYLPFGQYYSTRRSRGQEGGLPALEGVEEEADDKAREEASGDPEEGGREEHPAEEDDAEPDAHADGEGGQAAPIPFEEALHPAHEAFALGFGRLVLAGRGRRARGEG